eukprot:1364516-Amorphochlora_amoeboformis.AAC.1
MTNTYAYVRYTFDTFDAYNTAKTTCHEPVVYASQEIRTEYRLTTNYFRYACVHLRSARRTMATSPKVS